MTKKERELIKKKAVMDFRRGDRVDDIAIRYGKTIGTISTWARKAGIKQRRQGCRVKELPNVLDLKIVQLVKNRVNGNPSFSKIGEPYGLKRQSVHRMYHRWKDWTKNGVAIPFRAGDKIRFGNEDYTVVKADVLCGAVKDSAGNLISKFYWNHDGKHAVKL
jgi:transposase